VEAIHKGSSVFDGGIGPLASVWGHLVEACQIRIPSFITAKTETYLVHAVSNANDSFPMPFLKHVLLKIH
jgi:hypothetical protein